MFLPVYECICIVINGKTRSVPLNILNSVYTFYKQKHVELEWERDFYLKFKIEKKKQ